ncbi:MAG TPA: serine/threonine-protein kinase [Myxococcaceae bacterium]|nr:serine/threonine-protein kinase [Myxococcaceae bacterium]
MATTVPLRGSEPPDDDPTREPERTRATPDPPQESEQTAPLAGSRITEGLPEVSQVPLVEGPGLPKKKGEMLGRYLLLGQLGRGGMGAVYAAYDPELDRRVAIKVVETPDPTHAEQLQSRLLREAQAMARVSHPNVVPIHDVGTTKDGVFMAMDLVEGQTMRGWLSESKRSSREILRAFIDAGRGLQAAHGAGLVHRDFKPDNVLIARDGRVMVTDFGLARLAATDLPAYRPSGVKAAPSKDGPAPRSNSSSGILSVELTRAGVVMGTPNYMSVEQYRGEIADERSDQFSFCASLYWALFKQRPFEPQQMQGFVAEDAPGAASPVRPAPSVRTVPARVRRAIDRGMALEPAQRFPSMALLLRELEASVQRTWRTPAAFAGALAVAALGGTFAVQRQASDLSQRCTGGPKMLATAWNDGVRARLIDRFTATSPETGAGQAQRTATALDAYAASWLQMHREACEATAVRHEQSEAVMQLRMACLSTRLKEVASLTALFSAGDKAVVKQSVDAALGLSSLRGCADIAALTGVVPLPEEPAARREADAISSDLAEINALRLAGNYALALERTQASAARAAKLGYRPLEALAAYYRGLLEDRVGKPEEGQRSLQAAVGLADAARDDALKVRIASRLVYLMQLKDKFQEGHLWEGVGRGALERGGGDEELEGDLLSAVGQLLLAEGRPNDAVEMERRGVALLERALGPNSSKRANALGNLGIVELEQGRRQDAVTHLGDAVTAIERLRGPDHPTLAGPLEWLGVALSEQGQFDRARLAVDRALAINRAKFGPTSLKVAWTLDNKAQVLQNAKRFDESLALYREALALKQAEEKPDPVALAYSLDGVGQSLLGLGKAKEAAATLDKALSMRGPETLPRGETRFALARALWAASPKDRARARQLLAGAKSDFEAGGREDKALEVDAWLASALKAGPEGKPKPEMRPKRR